MTDLTIIQKITILALPLIFAITLHEVAHGYVAYLFGDYTAKLSGRLSLNPLKHVDPIGTIVIPFLMLLVSNFIFGWAKPVPVDVRNMHHPRLAMALVALAGPFSNIIMALLWGLIAMLAKSSNEWLGVPIIYMGSAGIMINVFLAVLNLIPLPPLDGSRILSAVLPRRAAYSFNLIEPYGFFILVILLVSGVLSSIMNPVVFLMINSIGHLFGL